MPRLNNIRPLRSPDGVTVLSYVASPFKLGKLPSNTKALRVYISGTVTDADAQKLREYTRKFKDLVLGVDYYPNSKYNLQFLKHFPDLEAFAILDHDFADEAGLMQLPVSLKTLNLGQPRRTGVSLKFLERLTNLEYLGLEKQHKDIEVVGRLKSLRELMLRSITVPNLEFLLPLKKLRSLDIKLGGTNQLDLVPKIGRLKYLELWKINGLTELGWLPEVKTLQYLWLQALGHVGSLPSFKPLRALRRVHLETLHGLHDLQPVADAPKLEDLVVSDMRHLTAEAFQPFVGHRSLQTVLISLGSKKRDAQAEELLPFPTVEYPFNFR